MVWTGVQGVGVDLLTSSWEQFTGVPLKELYCGGILHVVHPDEQELHVALMADYSLIPEELRFRLRRHDGAWRWMEARMRVIDGGDGSPPRIVGVTTDIHDRVEAELELERRNHQLAAILDLVDLGGFTWHFGADGQHAGLTPDGRLGEIMGFTSDDFQIDGDFSGFITMIHPDDREMVGGRIAAALGGENDGDYRAEYRFHRPLGDGHEERWFSARGRVTFGRDGKPTAMTGALQDITDQRRAERRSVRLQKLEATATLAGGVAHDFGNLIGAILSTARVGEAQAAAGAHTAETFEDIAIAAGRARELVDQLMSFARPQAPQHELLDLRALAEEAARLVSPGLGPTTRVTVTQASELPTTRGDAGQIHQVLVNLLTNAGHAIGAEPGEISITLDRVDGSDGGACARIQVRDSGCGMAREVIERVFDPFFTTRVDHGGTGLGLAAVQSIVTAHDGSVDLESAVGGGTTFSVLLPAED